LKSQCYYVSTSTTNISEVQNIFLELEKDVLHTSDFSFLESLSSSEFPEAIIIESSFNFQNIDLTKFAEFQKEYQIPISCIQYSLEETIDFSSFPFSISSVLYMFQPKELVIQTLQCFLHSSRILKETNKSLLRYREIINEVTNLFTLINEKSEFVYSSPSMKHLHGYEEGELQGKSFINFIHPDDLPLVLEEFQKTLQSTSYNPLIEFRLKTKMGHYVTLEAQANNQLNNPDIRAIIVNSKDISEFKSVENSFKIEEERISKAFSLTGQGIWDYSIKENTVSLNSQMFLLLGVPYEKKTFTFDEFLSLFDEQDKEHFRNAILESYVEGGSFYHEHIMYHSINNESVWVLERGAVVERNLIGQPSRIIGTTTDVTKRKTFELELQKSHENLNKLTNNIPGMLFQLHLSLDGEYTFPYLSSSASEILNIHQTKQPIYLEDHITTIHPEDIAFVLDSIANSAKNLTIWEIDFRVVLLSKGIQWRHGKSRPERLHDGSILWNGYISDATERKQIEEQLTIKDTVIEASINGNVIFDLEGYITYSNTAFEQMWGLNMQAEPLHLNILDLFVDINVGVELLTSLLIGNSWTGELKSKTVSEKIFFANIVATLIKSPNGSPLCIYASVLDVTEKKQIEAHFLRNQRMDSIGTLAGGIAHDLNNVLTPILLSIEILKLQTSDEKFLYRLDLIETSTKRGAELIKQVLLFSRGVEGERSAIQLKKLTDEMVMIMKSTFPKNIVHSVMLEQQLPTFLGDYTQLHQVLLNLCVNARDAMPNGGLLSINAKKITFSEESKFSYLQLSNGEYIQISVTDSGTGMTQEVLDRVFEPFYTTKDIGLGTGIGLSTVLSIVKSHKGVIDVQSEIKQGTSFELFFPIGEQTEEINLEIENRLHTKGVECGVLIVDDEEAIREFSVFALEPLGFTVYTASDSFEAISTLSKNQNEISLLIVDMILPGPDGKSVIKKAREKNPSIHCIAVSGIYHSFDEDPIFEKVLFLQKPYSTSQLILTVQTLIGS